MLQCLFKGNCGRIIKHRRKHCRLFFRRFIGRRLCISRRKTLRAAQRGFGLKSGQSSPCFSAAHEPRFILICKPSRGGTRRRTCRKFLCVGCIGQEAVIYVFRNISSQAVFKRKFRAVVNHKTYEHLIFGKEIPNCINGNSQRDLFRAAENSGRNERKSYRFTSAFPCCFKGIQIT